MCLSSRSTVTKVLFVGKVDLCSSDGIRVYETDINGLDATKFRWHDTKYEMYGTKLEVDSAAAASAATSASQTGAAFSGAFCGYRSAPLFLPLLPVKRQKFAGKIFREKRTKGDLRPTFSVGKEAKRE